MGKKIKKYLNYDNKLNKIDFITILIIVLLYSFLSFYRLGSNISPNTFERVNKNDKLLIELKEMDDVIKFKIFSGEQNSKYKLYLSNLAAPIRFELMNNGVRVRCLTAWPWGNVY